MADAIPETDDLPLRSRTPAAWVHQVMRDPLALLSDHAHLEKKAAANALDMLNRWPNDRQPSKRMRQAQDQWVQTMTAVARDEVEHLGAVVRLLNRRGGRLSRTHRNPYAAGLRDMVRAGGADELIDRLLISAMIELRSCERFVALAQHADDPELVRLYRGLWVSERGHYTVFLQLAQLISRPSAVDRRWHDLLDAEAQLLAEQPATIAMHSGYAACGLAQR